MIGATGMATETSDIAQILQQISKSKCEKFSYYRKEQDQSKERHKIGSAIVLRQLVKACFQHSNIKESGNELNSGVIRFQSSFSLQFFFSLISVWWNVLQLAYLQPVQDALHLIYTAHEPDCKFVNKNFFICLIL